MTYWAQGQVFTLSDMPRATDFDFAYTRANVIDGKFTYSSASERTRYTRALISYDNPLNNYDTDVTAVTDQKLQRRYGDNPLEISAIGCTRESEAQRRGKWALLTNSKDRAVTFKVGLDGRIPLPGYVTPIADELLAGRPVGGRISVLASNAKVFDLHDLHAVQVFERTVWWKDGLSRAIGSETKILTSHACPMHPSALRGLV